MKLVMYQDCISPHQIPLARELAQSVGIDEFRYVYRDKAQSGRTSIGWSMDGCEDWMIHIGSRPAEAQSAVEESECLLTMFRDMALFERRAARGLRTFLQTERWFKPRAGILRLLSPSYRRMARRFVRLLDCGSVVYLPMGIHAARDMARLCGLMHGDLRCLFRAPRLEFERWPGGGMWIKDEPRNTLNTRKYCLGMMRMWGYFVEQRGGVGSDGVMELKGQNSNALRVLWVGRLLDWKRVDTIIRAVGYLAFQTSQTILLDICGAGPEEGRLKKLAAKYGDAIRFYPPVPIGEVRKFMRGHDVYVLASNGYEGWGAVASEALEEGMRVLGTYEAGSSATILPKERLFHAGDWRALMKLLEREISSDLPPCSIGKWTAKEAAGRLVDMV